MVEDGIQREWRLTWYGYPEYCDLPDIKLEGHPYTWIKSTGIARVAEERLDCAMANFEWLHMYPEVKLTNLVIV